jgi:hypothetical protein
MHPERSGRPVLAIECDGASYHSSATARDRDRLRQAHLQRLGWRFHRIWSTDWFYNREEEIQRAVLAYEEAIRKADLADMDATPTPLAQEPESTRQVGQQPVSRRRGPQPHVSARESIDAYSSQELRRIAEWIISDGLLRTDEQLIGEIFAMLPFQRMGAKIRKRLEVVARTLH